MIDILRTVCEILISISYIKTYVLITPPIIIYLMAGFIISYDVSYRGTVYWMGFKEELKDFGAFIAFAIVAPFLYGAIFITNLFERKKEMQSPYWDDLY